ncbi:uncharacterized protein [Palaemon carinicauda]|uniref:uncharacterized protein n=1 Tax=Palaemon carinicauda TaxID=392227 RepID=UPI0035B64F4E
MKILILLCTVLVSRAEKLDDHGSLRPGLTGLLPSSFALGERSSAHSTGSSTVHAHQLPTGISLPVLSDAPSPGTATLHAHGLSSSFPQHQTFSQTGQGSFTVPGTSSQLTSGQWRGTRCPKGQVHQFFGGPCVTPRIERKFWLHEEPRTTSVTPSRPEIPQPTVEYNYIFIRAQEKKDEEDHIIIPPPQKKHVIFVLNKEHDHHDRKIVQFPESEAHNPEVVFINYADGETPILPDGINFHDALRSAMSAKSQVIDGHDQHGSSHQRDDLGAPHGTTTGQVADTGSHHSEGLVFDIRSADFGNHAFDESWDTDQKQS